MKYLLSLALLLAAGCVQTRVTTDGTSLETTRFLWPGKIAKASVTSTNGTSLTIEGYQSDAAQLAEGVATGIAKGLSNGVKP